MGRSEAGAARLLRVDIGAEFTYGSLFTGIGGMDLGLDRAGMTCKWQVEIDDFCQRVLKKHWPDVPKHRDVKHVGKEQLSAVDLIAGGFPCQPHSVAGKQRGAEDDRNLWPEFARIIAELRPAWVLAENVPGIKNTILDQTLADLEDMDYEAVTIDIPAVALDAYHLRHRFFIVAHTKRIKRRGGRNRFERNEQERGAAEEGAKSIQPQDWKAHASDIKSSGSAMAHTSGAGLAQPGTRGKLSQTQRNAPAGSERGGSVGANVRPARWPVEPNVGRVAHGVPDRVDRIRGLGNAVVPQVAQFMGELIVATHYNYLGD